MSHKIEIALFEPQIPQNVGTILRTASCFNVIVNIILPCGFVLGNSLMRRAGMDYLSEVKYNLFDNFEYFRAKKNVLKQRIILVTTKTDKKYNQYSFHNNDILLFGNETLGVPQEVHNNVCDKITIPMFKGRSLNLAVACGIVVSRAIHR